MSVLKSIAIHLLTFHSNHKYEQWWYMKSAQSINSVGLFLWDHESFTMT